jgi:hypothetical protein
MGPVHHKVIRPDVVPVQGPQPNTGSIVQPDPAPFGLVLLLHILHPLRLAHLHYPVLLPPAVISLLADAYPSPNFLDRFPVGQFYLRLPKMVDDLGRSCPFRCRHADLPILVWTGHNLKLGSASFHGVRSLSNHEKASGVLKMCPLCAHWARYCARLSRQSPASIPARNGRSYTLPMVYTVSCRHSACARLEWV